jgi:hypothetical protein
MPRRSQWPLMRRDRCPEMRFVGLVAALACAVVVASCASARVTYSGAAIRHAIVSRPMPVRVALTPMLDGGSAGWCVGTTRTSTAKKRSGAGGCGGVKTSTGAIFYETCSETETGTGNETAYVVILTRGEVSSVAVAGGAPIPTESNPTLPGGLRAAAIELPGYRIIAKPFAASDPWSPCPRVTALDANDEPIAQHGRSGVPLTVELPRRYWYRPARPPSGVCRLTATRLPPETVAIEGTVALRVRPLPELLGRAFVSCADTTYFYQNNHDLPAAVLLDAAHPGAVPPDLLGMKPLAGHPSVFEAPPDLFGRRIRGAWLVVKEEDNIGPSVPVELLDQLRATVDL